MCVRFLVQENLLEKGMTTHCSILAWEIPWTEEPGGLQSIGSQRVRQDLATNNNKINFAQEQFQFLLIDN